MKALSFFGLGAAIDRTIVAHDEGTALPIPEGFRFSRYTLTSDRDIAPRSNHD